MISWRSLETMLRRAIWILLGAGFLLTQYGCTTGNTKPDPAANQERRDAEEFLNAGYEHLSRGGAKKAAAEFDKVIEYCKTEVGSGDRQVFAARSEKEILYYLLAAAAEKKNAAAVSPLCADAVYLKGYAVLELGRLEEAEDLLKRAVAMSPANSLYLSELGHIYHAKRDWDAALEIFTESEEAAQNFSPEDVKEKELARAMRGVGFSLIELNRLDEAEQKFNKCLEINENDQGAKQELEYIQQLRKAQDGDN